MCDLFFKFHKEMQFPLGHKICLTYPYTYQKLNLALILRQLECLNHIQGRLDADSVTSKLRPPTYFSTSHLVLKLEAAWAIKKCEIAVGGIFKF